MYERVGGFTARRIPLPEGDPGTGATLAIMHRLAVEGSRDLEVRAAAIEALDRAGAPSHHAGAALAALFHYVRDRIRFVGDPVGAQAIQSPRATLYYRAGNCAQRATLLAAMARSIGIPTAMRFRVVAGDRARPGRFSHVYVVASVNGQSVALDPTYPDNEPGYQYPNVTRIGDYRHEL